MKRLIIFMMPVLLLMSCKTQQLYLNVLEPAPVTIPAYIEKVGIIDRTMPTEKSKPADVVEKIITLEGPELDRDGARESIKGLAEQLKENGRFSEVKTLDDIDFRTPETVPFPTPLTWDIVDRICNEKGIDAIFALEKYDTDTHISYSKRNVSLSTPLGKVPGIEHQANMETIVKTGWRIYDPSGKVLLDEFINRSSIVSTGRGINPVVAAAALLGRKDAVNQVSYKSGQDYALRILPFRLRVMRDYYVKGTNNFRIAMRKARTGNWNQAGELWEKETTNPKRKVAGRAAYNMAIISEINGDLDAALAWAQKSYEDYNNHLAIRYVRILENRKYKTDVLKVQGEQ
ncbi:MAG TPA: DUF6340 family protein [Bacteroidales bacterium]|nr:DUF6340 family protein [Bacteroidales bacterium]